MAPPEWLTRHGGSLAQAPTGGAWLVFFDGAPRYRLTPAPADGKFTCRITQTENGKRVDKATIYPTADEALRGGLDELCAYLGW